MEETTRIVTVEITWISKGERMSKEEAGKAVEEGLKCLLNADHIQVTSVQDFVNEVKA